MLSKPRKRARNLDDFSINQIIGILDSWSKPKLTWDLLIEQIFLQSRAHYTRQALNNYAQIKVAFAARKAILARCPRKDFHEETPELQRITRLEAEIERLKLENNALLEQFNRWVYNGYLKQMDERMRDFMNQPLPQLDREPSKVHTRIKNGRGR